MLTINKTATAVALLCLFSILFMPRSGIGYGSEPEWTPAVGKLHYLDTVEGDKKKHCTISLISHPSLHKKTNLALTAGHCASHWGINTPVDSAQSDVGFITKTGKKLKTKITRVIKVSVLGEDYAFVVLEAAIASTEIKPLHLSPYKFDMFYKPKYKKVFENNGLISTAGFPKNESRDWDGNKKVVRSGCKVTSINKDGRRINCVNAHGGSGGPAIIQTNIKRKEKRSGLIGHHYLIVGLVKAIYDGSTIITPLTDDFYKDARDVYTYPEKYGL